MIFPFNFKKQFAPLVASGTKRQTIRRTRKDRKRPKPGDIVRCYTGLRTSHVQLLYESPVIQCRAVRIDLFERYIVVDGARLFQEEARIFAQADGFNTTHELIDFFLEQERVQEDPKPYFEGFCVEWERRAA